MRILLIEDEKELLSDMLTEVEKEYVVDVAYNGVEGSILFQSTDYDVLVVGAILPDMNGVELCRDARKENVKSPIIYIPQDSKPQSKIQALDAGADVSLQKPFDATELKAQVRALTRRSSMLVCGSKAKFGELEMDFKNRQVTIRGDLLPLRRKEYDLLEYLILNKGKVVSKEQLLEHVWQDGLYVFSNSVEVHIRSLRKRFLDRLGKRLVRTVRGFGYKIEL